MPAKQLQGNHEHMSTRLNGSSTGSKFILQFPSAIARCRNEVLAVFISTGNRPLQTTNPKLLPCVKRLLQDYHSVHHPCWFLAPIKLQSNEMRVQIPSLFQRHIFAPNQAVVLIKSGRRSYYTKIEDFVITLGWETIVIDHTFGQNYTALFGSIGHLMFDMFIFDHEGNSVQYNWSTTAPVEHPNAPPNWDSNQVLANVTGSTLITACTPKQFRQFNAEYRFCKKLNIANWSAMELCPSLQELAYTEGMNQFVVKTQQEAWYIWYASGRLEGLGWESFAAAHALKEHDAIVVTVANDLSLVAMVFDQDGCERTFHWYTDIETDAMSPHRGVH
ncbi:hypothetical protein RHGRI_015804 [Rhododendron griersonianum]|uniref:Uncharacterized protein n=1 Tax=Rhododendron griersonianum TaxID=479676 RepID=A0AAV6J7R8_9ERIC|nr:hypothetical protein RHGRI_022697 [Rhododendron griersonianum]KAG5537226.1 hypothetical protein RHGRI_024614 [Rhododendron griersonianum]KAG5542823.1 hypothetical protein RHGRI_015804 [Rhododendron griersonianum]